MATMILQSKTKSGSRSGSEYHAAEAFCKGPTPQAVLGVEATTYLMSSITKFESSSGATTYIGVSTKVINKSNPIHGGGITQIMHKICQG